ncbi:MAG: hypothetical protein ACOYNS_03315 [Bacteroidota bacterium]
MTRITIIALLFSLFVGCGVTQPVRPIEEGKSEIIASFGGPIIPVGSIAFPVPYLNVGMLYGVQQNLTVYGNAHVTALLFKDIGVDGGFCARLLPEKGIRPEITVNGRAYIFSDAFRGNTTRFFPMATLTGSYSVGERSLIYFGADNLYQFSSREWFVSSFVGYSFPVGSSVLLQCETKWMAMNKDTRHGVFEGLAAVGGKGNIGLFIGLQAELQ